MIKSLLKPKKDLSLFSKVGTVLAAFAFLQLWTVGVFFFYNWLFAVDPNSVYRVTLQMDYFKHPMLIAFFFVCIVAPFMEEVLFRVLPIQLLKASKNPALLLPGVVFTSMIFGLLHQGAISILVQGVAGLVLSIVYIRNGYSYLSSAALHFMWNAALLFDIYKFL